MGKYKIRVSQTVNIYLKTCKILVFVLGLSVMHEIYHTLNRGVDKRIIFLDEQDYLRFIHDLYEFNDIEPVNNNFYIFNNIMVYETIILRRSQGDFW